MFAGLFAPATPWSSCQAGAPVRVRSIHAQNRPSDSGHAGQRCALNLVGIEKSAISRGDWLADRAHSHRRRVSMFACSCLQIATCVWRRGRRSTCTSGRLTASRMWSCWNVTRLSAGQSARVQLVFDTPLCAVPGDRFIARDAQAAHTVGGGIVLDPFAPSRKRRSVQRMRYLDALERMIAGNGIAPLLQHATFRRGKQRSGPLDRMRIRSHSLPCDAISSRRRTNASFYWPRTGRSLRERTLNALRDFHADAPDEPGPDAGRLRRIALPDVCQPLWLSLIDQLTREGLVMRKGPWLHLPEHTAELSADDCDPRAKNSTADREGTLRSALGARIGRCRPGTRLAHRDVAGR